MRGHKPSNVDLTEHALSPSLGEADDYVLFKLPDGNIETLPAKKIAEGIFKICCVPFHAYDLDHGDRVSCDKDNFFSHVIEKSGDCGFRFKSNCKDEETLSNIVAVLESYGAILEFMPTGDLIAVNSPTDIDPSKISGLLASFEDGDYLMYETVRI